MTEDQIHDRAWALLATVADGRMEDIDALLDDLDPDDLGSVVGCIAALAVGFFMPRGTGWQDQGKRDRVAAELRVELLRRAVAEEPPDDAA